MKVYGKIENFRLLDVKVFVDDELKYEGRVENAPDEIKNSYYSKVITTHPLQIFVYNKHDEENEQKESV